MPFFENLQHRFTEQERQNFDTELSENLRDHLRSLSIESKIASPGSPECIQSLSRFGRMNSLLGCVKVNGFHFDQIDVIRHTISSPAYGRVSKEDPRVRVCFFYSFLINIPPGDLRKELNCEVKTIKKGLMQRETVDHEWRGGTLANRINTDSVLMMKIRNLKHTPPDGILAKLEFPWMKVESRREDDFIALWQLVHDPTDYPTKDGIEIADMVSKHIRNMIQL